MQIMPRLSISVAQLNIPNAHAADMTGDHLAVLTKTGSLHLGAANPEMWQESQRLDLFDDLAWTPPSYAGGAIYVRSLGEIARVNLVRVPKLVAETIEQDLPAGLEALASEVATAEATLAVGSPFPSPSRTVAVSCNDSPTMTLADEGDTTIEAGGFGPTTESQARVPPARVPPGYPPGPARLGPGHRLAGRRFPPH